MTSSSHEAVFLDAETLGKDFSLKTLEDLPFKWTYYPKSSVSETPERLKNAFLVVTNKAPLSKEVLEKAPNLKLICIAATGFDHVDMAAARQLGITVCNVPSYSTTSVSQLTMLFILALFNNLISYADITAKGAWQKSPLFTILDFPINDVEGKTLGIIGYGQLGKKVGELAKGFGMKVMIAKHQNPNKVIPGAVPLEDVLKTADVITLHAPLNSQTHHMISKKQLEMMRKSAFLINNARGGLVNAADLAEALKKGTIAGAAMDVLDKEPPPNDNPLLQKDVPHLIITPHIGWASTESKVRLLEILKKNISSFLEKKPQNVI